MDRVWDTLQVRVRVRVKVKVRVDMVRLDRGEKIWMIVG